MPSQAPYLGASDIQPVHGHYFLSLVHAPSHGTVVVPTKKKNRAREVDRRKRRTRNFKSSKWEIKQSITEADVVTESARGRRISRSH